MDFKVRIDVSMQYQDFLVWNQKQMDAKGTDFKHIMGCRLNNYEATETTESHDL